MAHQPFMLEPGHLDQVPAGWRIRVLGLMTGPPVEVAYHPDRHDVLVVAGNSLERLGRQLADAGWARLGPYTDGEVWTRDRLAATRAALAHHTTTAVTGRARPAVPPRPGGMASRSPRAPAIEPLGRQR